MILKLIIFIFSITSLNTSAELAIVTAPVIDLLPMPTRGLNKKLSAEQYYNQIPISPVRPGKDLQSCPRLHQALFNEVVDIVEQTTHEAKVKILNAYHLSNGKKVNAFWTLKKNLKPLASFNDNKQFLPTAVNFNNPNELYDANTATLITPWHCAETGQSFSAGTRFKLASKNRAYCYLPEQNKFMQVRLPKKLFIKSTKPNPQSARKMFITLVENWANDAGRKYIPYTWGGCSYIQRVPAHKTKTIKKTGLNYYQVGKKQPTTQSGLDCSGLVLRAAQTVGIPYFYKNTSTLLRELPQLKEGQNIEPGDLIWLSGHVIIIADPKTGYCLEARDFGHGYGKVQKIHISKLFKETPNMAKLKAAHLKGEPLTRLDKKGSIRGSYKIKIIKIA